MSDRSACPDCGASLVDGNPFCVECGARVSATSTAPQVANDASSSDLRPVVGLGGGGGVGGPSPITGQQPASASLSAPAAAVRHSGPVSAPVVPLPAAAETQPGISPVLEDEPTRSGEGPTAAIPDDVSEMPAFKPGDKVLRQYRIVRELGHGGMGAVYLAQDDLTGQQVAVKVLPAALAREKGIRERFTQEARALAALDHPSIVPLVSYAQDGDDRFLIMKYVEGTPLDDLIEKEGKLSFERAESIFRDLVGALGYAHAAGVVHRDVKPANVLIADDGRVFLVDFGIAKKEESVKLTQTGMLMGTPQYMSPELISGHPVDGRSDLYAAGLILFEMLAGRAPFVGERTFTVLRAHVEGAVPDPVALRGEPIPTPLLVVIDQLLKKRPDDRPHDADRVLAVLDAANLETPVFGVDPGVVDTRSPADTAPTVASLEDLAAFEHEVTAAFGKARSRSMTIFGVGALFLAVAIIVAVIAIPRSPDEPPPRPKVAGEDEAMTLLKVAERKSKEGDHRGALEMLLAIEGPARNLVPIVLTEVDLNLELGKLDEAALLIKSLQGYIAQLTKAERKALADLEKKLTKHRESRARRAARVAAERAKLPVELTNEQILDVTQGDKSRTQLTFCWNETVLRQDPTAKGSVRIKAVVDPDGTVDSAKTLKDTVGNKRLKECVEKAARRWRFPQVRGPKNWTVVATFNFEGGK